MNHEDKSKKQLVKDLSETPLNISNLKDTEEKFAKVFLENAIPMGITALSDGRFIDVSNAFLKLMGCNRDEIVGHTSVETGFITPEDRALFFQEMDEKGRIENYEMNFRMKGGVLRHGLFNAVKISLGNEMYLLTVMTDITERKNAEEALRLSEVRYRQLYESMMDGFVSGNLRGYGIEANDAFLNMLGYSREELHSLNYKKITPKKWHAVDKIIMKEQLLTRGYSDVFEKEFIRKDGTVFPVELRTTLLRDEDGNSIGFWSIIRDITKRKQSEEPLAKSQEKYRVITENIIDCIALVDKGGIIQYVSNSVEVVGYEPEELMNINALSRTHPDDLDRVRKIYHDSINRGWREIIYETRIRHKNGEYLPLEIRERVLKDSHEKFIGSVCVVRKITQRRQQEQLLAFLDHNFVDSRLTTRENEILDWVMKGKSTWDIAKILAISESTVKFHIDHIMKKFKAVNRAHAVAIALQRQQIGFD